MDFAPGATDANGTGIDGGPAVDVCTVSNGALAWTVAIPETASSLVPIDVAVGPTNDVVVADITGGNLLEQRRWDKAGAFVSAHQDPAGTYTGPIFASSIVIDAANDLFYGVMMTGQPQGANLGAALTFTRLSPSAGITFSTTMKNALPATAGSPAPTLFDVNFDSSGNVHGPLAMGAPQYFAPDVYCYKGDGTNLGGSAPNVVTGLAPGDNVWPTADGGLYLAKGLTVSTDFGCGNLPVGAAGGVALAKFTGAGNCTAQKLLALPTAAVKQRLFRVGTDDSLLLAVVYAGTIDFGGGALVSTGTSSLALARFDSSGKLLFAKSFGGVSSSFTLGSLMSNGAGAVVLTGGYAGSVDLGGGALTSSGDTFVAVFDSSLAHKWSRSVSVGGQSVLKASIGPCGAVLITNSPTVDLGFGPLSHASSVGVAALGL